MDVRKGQALADGEVISRPAGQALRVSWTSGSWWWFPQGSTACAA